MMKEIVLDNTLIKYKISYKSNKNTYFYFKKKGYIQINASKNQTEKEILLFMKKNRQSFLKKYKDQIQSISSNQEYRIWGNVYKVKQDLYTEKLYVDHLNLTVIEPLKLAENLENQYKKIEKEILLNEVDYLRKKYLDNPYIDISDIKIRTRYTTTRFGSCNARLKSINLNLKLVSFPKEFLEYVFLHEICHLVHQNHSKDFYQLLKKICPNYKALKKELNIEFNR